jgi:RimJ/RimL family protein N-acetyltransferase
VPEQEVVSLGDGLVMRRTRSSDLGLLLEMQRVGAVAGLGNIFPQQDHPFPSEEIRRRWEREIADPTLRCYVVVSADQDRGVLGFAALRGAELLHFGTALDTWGSGLAVRFHDALIATYDAQTTLLFLRVFEDNVRARRFYEKLGWQCTGVRTATSFPPHPTLVRYERSLDQTARSPR